MGSKESAFGGRASAERASASGYGSNSGSGGRQYLVSEAQRVLANPNKFTKKSVEIAQSVARQYNLPTYR